MKAEWTAHFFLTMLPYRMTRPGRSGGPRGWPRWAATFCRPCSTTQGRRQRCWGWKGGWSSPLFLSFFVDLFLAWFELELYLYVTCMLRWMQVLFMCLCWFVFVFGVEGRLVCCVEALEIRREIDLFGLGVLICPELTNTNISFWLSDSVCILDGEFVTREGDNFSQLLVFLH